MMRESPLHAFADNCRSKDYRKVPIATLDGEQVNGSDGIIKKCLEHPAVQKSLLLRQVSIDFFVESVESKTWVLFAREDLASLLYPNICSTWNDSYFAFKYVNEIDQFSSFQKFAIQNVGSLAMYFAASKIKRELRQCILRNSLGQISP